jgi:hypothetical protein
MLPLAACLVTLPEQVTHHTLKVHERVTFFDLVGIGAIFAHF